MNSIQRLIAVAVCCLASSVHADNLVDKIKPLVDEHQGQVAVAVKDLKTGEFFALRGDEPMPTASLIKFPLMIAAYQAIEDEKLKLDAMIKLTEADKVPGSGILTSHFSDGAQISLRDAIHLMMVYSDNTATNLVVDAVGLKATAELMDKLGCPETKLHSKVYRRDTSIFPDRSKKYGLGSTTPADMVKLLELLSKRELVSKDASEKMLAHMYACEDKQKFPRFMPGVKIAHKTGSIEEVRTDAGLIDGPNGPIALCVMTNENEDRSWENLNEAEILCGRIAQIAYRHFNGDDEAPATADSGVLKLGATGMLVEALQRTLNERMKPSPDLGVDGDFGSMTEGAVVDFQKSNGIEPNGVVGPETWKTLGTLVENEPEAEDPAAANARAAKKEPADALDGPPFVTCKAWAIADGDTGKLLWGSNEKKPVDIASTTKIMTAYLVLRYAQEHPECLDETVTFSKRADDTIGSTAAVRTGETLSVRELLYGLLLPSGNDASVAFAEHFGARVSPGGDANVDADEKSPKDDSKKAYDAFIDAMNQAAKDLSMQDSHFENPNGLTESGHQVSAADLLKLAHASMKLERFRDIVSTPQHVCTVEGPGGYKRNVMWNNTNHLLGIEGYDGVKTGTTTAAGACLVSRGTRGDDSLMVVVLGAASSESRYTDTRNLYRWAWTQLDSRP